jgi:hypothetical protein
MIPPSTVRDLQPERQRAGDDGSFHRCQIPAPYLVYDTNADAFFTLHWSNTISADGKVIFQCIYAEHWEFEWPE